MNNNGNIPNHVTNHLLKKKPVENYPPELVPIDSPVPKSPAPQTALPPLIPLDSIPNHLDSIPNHIDSIPNHLEEKQVASCYGCGCDTGSQCDQCGTPVCIDCVGCERHGLVCAAIHDEEYVGISLSEGDLKKIHEDRTYLVAHDLKALVPKAISEEKSLDYALDKILDEGVSVYKVNTGRLGRFSKLHARVTPVGTGAMTEEVNSKWYIYPAIVLINTDEKTTTAGNIEKSHKRALVYLKKHWQELVKDANIAVAKELARLKNRRGFSNVESSSGAKVEALKSTKK